MASQVAVPWGYGGGCWGCLMIKWSIDVEAGRKVSVCDWVMESRSCEGMHIIMTLCLPLRGGLACLRRVCRLGRENGMVRVYFVGALQSVFVLCFGLARYYCVGAYRLRI